MPLKEAEKRLIKLAAAQSKRANRKATPRVRAAIRRAKEKAAAEETRKSRPSGVAQESKTFADRKSQEKKLGLRRGKK